MKNQIKTLRASALLLLLFVTSISYSQSLTGVSWQQQNPDIKSYSLILSFKSNGEYSSTTIDLQSGRSAVIKGTWNLSKNILTMTPDGQQTFEYSLIWLSKNKIKTVGYSQVWIFAKSGSDEDWFMTNYFNSIQNGYNNYNNGTIYNNQSSTTCYTCYGTGSCKVCNGSKIYSIYGNSSPCSACSGTGKCWHCHGTRKQ